MGMMTDVQGSLGTSHEALCRLSLCQETPVLGATGQGWAGLGERIRPPPGARPPLRCVWLGQLLGAAAFTSRPLSFKLPIFNKLLTSEYFYVYRKPEQLVLKVPICPASFPFL